jgi:hypothetical protein
MPLTKPYFRIWREGGSTSLGGDYDGWYPFISDPRYCQERTSLCRAYKMIEKDLEALFEYIEPCDANNSTHSHRTFELMLRACTEFEANCKGILLANGYSPTKRDRAGVIVPRASDKWNISDYWRINRAVRLSDYKVLLKSWHPNPLELQPFRDWHGVTSHQGLSWYQAYNEAKHNRDTKFACSNFKNTIEAIAGLLCILFSQFNVHTTYPYRSPDSIHCPDELGMQGIEGSMFDIAPPIWSSTEDYDFDWECLKLTPNPYEQFSF